MLLIMVPYLQYFFLYLSYDYRNKIFKVDIKYWYNLPYNTYSKGYSNATNYGTF